MTRHSENTIQAESFIYKFCKSETQAHTKYELLSPGKGIKLVKQEVAHQHTRVGRNSHIVIWSHRGGDAHLLKSMGQFLLVD